MAKKIKGKWIQNDTITNANINPAAEIELSKLEEEILQADGGQALTSDWDIGGSSRIKNSPQPLDSLDVSNKQYVDNSIEDVSEIYNEQHTLTADEITAKTFNLSVAPAISNRVMMDVIGGTSQNNGVDFTVNGFAVSWDGLGLDGVLITGDVLRMVYPI